MITLVEYARDGWKTLAPITIDKEGALESLLTDKYKLPEAIAESLADFFRLIAPGNKKQPLYVYVQDDKAECLTVTKILASKANFERACPDISKCPILAVLIERGHNNTITHITFLIKQQKSQGPNEPLAQHAVAFGFRRKADGTIEEYDVSSEDLGSLGYKSLELDEVFLGKKRYINDQLRGVLKIRLEQDY